MRESLLLHAVAEHMMEDLLDEAIRVRRYPGLAFRGPAHGRRAWLVGTSLDVWEVIEAYQSMG